MKRIDFNKDWSCYRTKEPDNSFPVTIPHDAMLLDEKSEQSVAGVNTGWYEAMDYTYEKTFLVPQEYQSQELMLEFEGVYHRATIYINKTKVAYHDYGYTGFYVNPEAALQYGKENTIRVSVINSDQPNSRWYSGTGIYRPVWLYVLPKQHIKMDGIRITTLSYKKPQISVEVKTNQGGNLKIEILDPDTKEILAVSSCETEGICSQNILLPTALCWSPKQPKLYCCRATFGDDVREETFGIRIVECNSKDGFQINGERVILKGACIHHDNGLLGACAYDYAEERKIRILKDAGYNAVRSAHNPCSKAMLRACDEMGMLMMDEYVDVWYIHKTQNDYANEVEKNYREDLKLIVDKDYNHPSVVLYSTGNEVSETAQKKGIRLCGNLTDYLHEIDGTRPVTCGINIFFNFLSSMGFGVYSDKKAEQQVENVKKKKAVGSEFFNNLAGLFGSNFMKFGATLYPCDVKTRDSFANMDVAGYNYGIFRYEHDLKKYPKRLILGSETFCSDAYRFYELAKKEKRLIGDFVWAGMDYLGETGVGSWEYEEYAKSLSQGVGWVSAGSGRIDLTGKCLSEMKYTRVAFDLDKIGMGVVPVKFAKKKHSPSAWKMTNAMESWSYAGCEGMETTVEVYAKAARVDLTLNGKLLGSRQPKKDCKVLFPVRYEAGELKASSFDAAGKLLAETSLKTAKDATVLSLEPEKPQIALDGELCYLRLRYTDNEGVLKPLERGKIQLSVEGGTLLGFGSACPYYPDSYLSDTADTYYGEAMAIIRPEKAGMIKVHASSKYGNTKTEVKVV